MALLWLQRWVPFEYLSRDPAEILGARTYVGLVSNLGIVCWSGAAAVACFSGGVLSGRSRHRAYFLLALGMLSALLPADDLLMLHERVLPNRLGIPQPVVPVIYAVPVLSCLIGFRAEVIRTDLLLLVGSGAWMAVAVAADLAGDLNVAYKRHVVAPARGLYCSGQSRGAITTVPTTTMAVSGNPRRV